MCPCAGDADRLRYDTAVTAAVRAFDGDAATIIEHLTVRMAELAAAQRYEEAAMVRDRLSALIGAIRRQQLTSALREAGRCTIRQGDRAWIVDGARLVDVRVDGQAGRALPVEPPPAVIDARPLTRHHVDEALVLAKHFDKHGARLEISGCTGTWCVPLPAAIELPRLDRVRHAA
jgi:DNA polymerase-3 subunit epsilon